MLHHFQHLQYLRLHPLKLTQRYTYFVVFPCITVSVISREFVPIRDGTHPLLPHSAPRLIPPTTPLRQCFVPYLASNGQ